MVAETATRLFDTQTPTRQVVSTADGQIRTAGQAFQTPVANHLQIRSLLDVISSVRVLQLRDSSKEEEKVLVW